VLDVPCGQGRHAHLLAEAGYDVDGLDYSAELLAVARKRGTARNLRYVRGDMRKLPAQWTKRFDAVLNLFTSFGFFAHPSDDVRVIREFARVLKPGGRLLAIFPPFYHPGGAHLESWMSRMPWPNFFFGRETLIRAVQDIMRERNDGYQPHPMRPRDKLWTLNGTTIRSVRAMIRGRKLRSASMELAPLFSTMNEKWARWKMRYYAPFFRPLRHVPLLNELFVHRMKLDITK